MFVTVTKSNIPVEIRFCVGVEGGDQGDIYGEERPGWLERRADR